jgi:hypothetical protein
VLVRVASPAPPAVVSAEPVSGAAGVVVFIFAPYRRDEECKRWMRDELMTALTIIVVLIVLAPLAVLIWKLRSEAARHRRRRAVLSVRPKSLKNFAR